MNVSFFKLILVKNYTEPLFCHFLSVSQWKGNEYLTVVL